jgi:hypothetical protein
MFSIHIMVFRGGIYTAFHTVFPSDPTWDRKDKRNEDRFNVLDSDPEDRLFINEDL